MMKKLLTVLLLVGAFCSISQLHALRARGYGYQMSEADRIRGLPPKKKQAALAKLQKEAQKLSKELDKLAAKIENEQNMEKLKNITEMINQKVQRINQIKTVFREFGIEFGDESKFQKNLYGFGFRPRQSGGIRGGLISY